MYIHAYIHIASASGGWAVLEPSLKVNHCEKESPSPAPSVRVE